MCVDVAGGAGIVAFSSSLPKSAGPAYWSKTLRSDCLQRHGSARASIANIPHLLLLSSTVQLRYVACFHFGNMLWTSFVTILMLWCVGIVTSFTMSGLIHLLPVLAAAVAFVGKMQARDLI